ncbi:MAG: hypothetical protein CM15mP74_18260 [Halieaceae bacterium]|nr:MAG: hypothetical protein CM15mP74_18260 [Halieaceae bacterium]
MSDNKAALNAFREEVSAWMSENVPADPGFLLPLTFLEVGTEQQLDFLREWQHKLWSAGYLGMHWPSEYVGRAQTLPISTSSIRSWRSTTPPLSLTPSA